MVWQNLTTTVNPEIYKEIKKRGWVFRELLQLGYETRLMMGQENKKINQILEEMEDLRTRVSFWKKKSMELKVQIEELLEVEKHGRSKKSL